LERADSGELDNLVATANLLDKNSQARRRFVTEQQEMQCNLSRNFQGEKKQRE